ncbi:raffinose/stachyose/melibiose transport system permease protein [Anoxybacillus vitaminiphilus]|uniref:Raffinose/stachyose/melibiose transport system permease protein n=1 Tax=Paranoxybacillus vitaminiphilus TaxID=581036 RepID=A0A327YET1_9BACL|nr:sugar ABC transporter permease [Anoxybacillus vitaminiphilus]RAK19540.1 raffinose/stachyose/melibiose transport system permease protein [Anoxybacillus vitaminiphilus]
MKKQTLWYWLFLSPVLIALISVVVIPFMFGLYYSFTDWNGIQSTKFVGFEHYMEIFKDKEFISSLWFTVKFSIVSVILINFFGLSLALIVTQNIKTSKILRTVFFMPNLIGGLILGFIWQFIFIKVFASIGDLLNIESLRGWLSTPETGFWGLAIVMSWQMAGYIMVIYIAYLENIPQELLEAAAIDGANSFQRFRYITFPLVAPAFTVSLFLTLSNSFKLYDQNLSLTGGGPYNSTQMLAMEIFKTAFSENQMAYAQSKAVIFFIIVAVISLTQVYFNKKREVEM